MRELAPAGPTPLDAFERRADWHLAALIVALVVVPGFARGLAAAAEAGSATRVKPAAGAAAVPSTPLPRTRGVRPPRAC